MNCEVEGFWITNKLHELRIKRTFVWERIAELRNVVCVALPVRINRVNVLSFIAFSDVWVLSECHFLIGRRIIFHLFSMALSTWLPQGCDGSVHV